MTQNTLSTDVLIIGAGPAGLMAGTWMAQTGIKAMIIDKMPCRTQRGHADGIESRTFEILDSFGMADSIWKHANRTIDLSIWNDCESDGIQRQCISNNCTPGLSRFQEATLGQGQIEENFIDFIQESSSVEVKWNSYPVDLNMCEGSDYPVRVTVEMRTSERETSYTVNSKYLIACDGAHSWIRTALGLKLEGDQTDEKWGVIDLIPLTDFPDIRKRCIVKSDYSQLMIIPRERRLVRCYVQLPHEVAAVLWKEVDPALLVNIVKKILSPHTFEASNIEWSTIYTVGQRLCTTLSMYNRVFLAGDAIHTHSPKAGQGMNVSIQDTYNLGWKLASVIKGKAKSSILHTYQTERLQIAIRLIEFDKRMVQGVFQMDSASSVENASSMSNQMQDTLEEENGSASGVTALYKPSCLITRSWDSKGHQLVRPLLPYSKIELAGKLAVGARLPNTQVLFQCDSRPWSLQRVLRSTGEWHLFIFGGDVSINTQMTRVKRLASELSRDETLVNRINQRDHDCVGKISTYLVHCAPRKSVDLMELPKLFIPFDENLGYDYWRVFADEELYSEKRGRAYQQYGIGAEGCTVLVRPDQHVALIGTLDDFAAIELFLGNFMTLV
ncbi:Aromatic-ring hydroxylase-like [Penicillium roqueforti FM164]|uniref:Aromatic-ring hydroxylase-like n=1 Tax=Penicillium roqueforti (strain FM164) TaxID=1365484 RepID=W6QF77_PENRF|nr:Aromatic-ring hydroxylase-like [Penicillium roqueforti FM164]